MLLFLQKSSLFEANLKQHIAKIKVWSDRAFLVNIADLHMGLNNRKLFQQTLAFLMTIPNLFFTLGGDSGNGCLKLSKGNVTEEEMSGNAQLFAIAEDLQPVVDAGRLLAIIDGNHLAGRYKEITYSTPEEMLAHLLGKPELYKKEFAFVYVQVGQNTYVHFVQHKSGKAADKHAWINADVVWREHVHQYKAVPHVVISHDLSLKRPLVRETWEVFSGHWQILPSYSKTDAYRIVMPGCYIMEMSGVKKDWKLTPWRDEDLYRAVQNGYAVGGEA